MERLLFEKIGETHEKIWKCLKLAKSFVYCRPIVLLLDVNTDHYRIIDRRKLLARTSYF